MKNDKKIAAVAAAVALLSVSLGVVSSQPVSAQKKPSHMGAHAQKLSKAHKGGKKTSKAHKGGKKSKKGSMGGTTARPK